LFVGSFTVCHTMSRGIFAFYGVTDLSTIATVDSFSRTFRMPFVTISVPVRDPCNCLPTYSSPLLASWSSTAQHHSQPPVPSSHQHLHHAPSMSSAYSSLLRTPGAVDPAPVADAGYFDGAPGAESGDGKLAVDTSSGPGGYLLFVRPFYDQALLAVIRHYRWTRVFYIYDSDAGR